MSTQVVQRLQQPSNSKTYSLWEEEEEEEGEVNLDMIPGRYPNNINFKKIFSPSNEKKSSVVLFSMGNAYYYE